MADNITKMNLNITVDDGYQRVPINNKYGDEIGVFYFNPTDIGIIERYNTLADKFNAITEPLEAVESIEGENADELEARQLKALDEAKKRLYEAVDELFGGNAAEAFFGKVHPFSPVGVKKYTQNRAQRRAKK